LVEHQLWELAVAGSNPVAPTISFSLPLFPFAHRAAGNFVKPICWRKLYFLSKKKQVTPAALIAPNF
jgi:hypothetical protein